MITAIEIIHNLENFYLSSVEIEIFEGISCEKELDIYIESELETYCDIDLSIVEMEDLALQASMDFFSDFNDPDRLQECICISKQIDFMISLNAILNNNAIEF